MRRVTEAAHAVQHCGCEQLAGGEYKLVRGEQRGGIAQQRCRFGAWAGQVAQQRGISAAPAPWAAAAAHGRVERAAARRRCRCSAVAAAAAHGRVKRGGVSAAPAPWARRVRWHSSAAPAPPPRAVARRWHREGPDGAEARRSRGGGAVGRSGGEAARSRSQPHGRNPEQRRSSGADDCQSQRSAVDWRGGAGAASRPQPVAPGRRAAQSGDIERRGSAGQRSRPQSGGERRRGRAS